MYTYVSSILRKKGGNEPYLPVDIRKMPLREVFDNYLDGYIELNQISLTKNIFVKLEDLRSSPLPWGNGTFETWLRVYVANTTIHGSIVKPRLVEESITFSDAIQAGFDFQKIHHENIINGDSYPDEQLRDLFLSKPLPNVGPLQINTIVTVNGLLHYSEPEERGLRVKEGGRTVKVANDNHVGVISFEKIGKVTQVPILPKYIQPLSDRLDASYRKAAYINLGRSLKGKSLLLSFMGRLLDHDCISYDNHGLVRIETHKLDIAQLILDSRSVIDLSSLELEEREYLVNAIHDKNAIDSETVRRILLLMQTFFIIVDRAVIIKQLLGVNKTELLNHYEVQHGLPYPYISDKGFMYPYWRLQVSTPFVTISRLYVKDSQYLVPVHPTGDNRLLDERWINNSHEITHVQYDIGHLVHIYGQELFYEG